MPKVVPPGPDNPLGAYALYLGWSSYLIHGVDDWRRVGRRDSRGCMGMYDKDIETMYQQARIGSRHVCNAFAPPPGEESIPIMTRT